MPETDETRLEIVLPAELLAFVKAEAAHQGCASSEEYVRLLVRRAFVRFERHLDELERRIARERRRGE